MYSKSEEGVLVKMAYGSEVTGMITVAGRYLGWKIYRGVDVLEVQAYVQFELWTERAAPVGVMRANIYIVLRIMNA